MDKATSSDCYTYNGKTFYLVILQLSLAASSLDDCRHMPALGLRQRFQNQLCTISFDLGENKIQRVNLTCKLRTENVGSNKQTYLTFK